MAAEWLLDIDPDATHWQDNGRNNWTNTVTGKTYNSGDMVNMMLAKINAQNKAEGKGPYVPSYTGLPDGLKPETWGQGSEPAPEPGTGTDTGSSSGGSSGGGSSGGGQIGSGNAAQDWSDFFLGGITPGFTWNPQGGSGGDAFGEGSGTAEGPSWQSGQMAGGGTQYTGQREAFRPFGDIQAYSSEILRYGGPVSGTGGRWTGVETPEMKSVGGTTNSPTSVTVPEFTGYQQQLPGGGYQNIVVDKRDGEIWTDPATGQDYVWRNGRFQKADLKNRTGPTEEGPKVTTTGGTGTEDDPLRLILGSQTDPQTLMAQLLRQGVT